MSPYTPRELIPDQRQVSVGTSLVEIVPQTMTSIRTWIVIENTSTGGQQISLGFGKDAVAGVGEVLAPGAVHSEVIDSALRPTNLRITAIGSAAGGTLAVQIREVPL